MIVGNAGGTNVGASLHRAAEGLGFTSCLCDARSASSGSRILSAVSWRLLGHRPAHLERFTNSVVERCRIERPRTLIATGSAPLTADGLAAIGELGVLRINFSTDDPWNPAFKSRWFSTALRRYDRVYTARRSNCEDLRQHGCKHVSWLPFAYDESLWVTPAESVPEEPASRVAARAGVFFAGAAEKFRIQCVRELVANGIRVALAGDYWNRIPDLRKWTTGHLSPAQLLSCTRFIPVSLCLVRRANRDGHVMRTWEIPATGACILAEDTDEHREILGPEGVSAVYFRSPPEMVEKAHTLLFDESLRKRLAMAVRARIRGGPNTYRDRLKTMLGHTDLAGVEGTNGRTAAAATI
jgi:spore maturation protein CgeB